MFLIIDYDQGCGGERLCACLSDHTPCIPLPRKKILNQTKVKDFFFQEFLKHYPQLDKVKIPNNNNKIQIIPTHRHTPLIKSFLNDTVSVRIKWPEKFFYVKKVVAHLVDKLYLNVDHNPMDLIGYVKQIYNIKNNKNTPVLDGRKFRIDYYLEAKNLESNTENRLNFIKTLLCHDPEPKYHYDYIIPYEYFYENHNLVLKIFKKIGINVTSDIFKSYV